MCVFTLYKYYQRRNDLFGECYLVERDILPARLLLESFFTFLLLFFLACIFAVILSPKFVQPQNSILISQRAARYICCIHPNLLKHWAYKWSEGAAPLVSPVFCQTTALIQDDCGCGAIPGWMGPAFRELQGPAVPLLS